MERANALCRAGKKSAIREYATGLQEAWKEGREAAREGEEGREEGREGEEGREEGKQGREAVGEGEEGREEGGEGGMKKK